jgi:hypothetical protein
MIGKERVWTPEPFATANSRCVWSQWALFSVYLSSHLLFLGSNGGNAEIPLDFYSSTRHTSVYRWLSGRYAFHMTFSLGGSSSKTVEWSKVHLKVRYLLVWRSLDTSLRSHGTPRHYLLCHHCLY